MSFTAANEILMPLTSTLQHNLSLATLLVAQIQGRNGWQSANPKVQQFAPFFVFFEAPFKNSIKIDEVENREGGWADV